MEEVIRYYEETWNDYRSMWSDRHSQALHFGYYDDTARTHVRALLNTNRVLSDLAQVRPGTVVLDAGCGVGGSTCWLAEYRDARCVGISPVVRQVRQARALAVARGVSEKVQFVCTDYTRASFADRTFDVVWALESVCHAAQKESFYREAARLLKPGGRLVIAEYMRISRPAEPAEESLLREWFKGWSMPDLDTRDEHHRHAEDAGFAHVAVRDFTPVVIKSLRRLHGLALTFGMADWILHRIGLRSGEQHRNVIASRVQYEAVQRNLWFYGVLSARMP
ncbi:MAG: methyltransferase domain-containing protein [Burkholderiaceae bacterium]